MRRRIVQLARSSAFQIAAAYCLIASAWIILSDRAAARLFPEPAQLARVSQYKGLAFVLVTTILLYIVLRRRLEAMEASRRAVEASERRFAAFMDNLPVAAFLRDRSGRYVYVNRYWMENFAQTSEWAGKQPRDLFAPEIVALADEDHARILAGEPVAERILALPVRGEERIFLVRRFPVPSESGLLVGAFAVDITEQRRLEEHLRQAARMEAIGLLAGGVAHDFNNLLTVIQGHAQAFHRPDALPEQMARAAAEIRRAAERATQLIAQLLQFDRKQRAQHVPLDVNAAAGQVLGLVERLLGDAIRLRRRFGEGLPPVAADRSQIEQILLNLIVNARDAMPEGGAIEVETSFLDAADPAEAARLGLSPGPYVRLSVRDEGHGMDEATRARIFEPFFTTKEPGKGTGLGLTSVYGIVQSLGGAIRVDSAPGRGTRFDIDLPAARPEGQAAGGESAAGKQRILLVEDDDAVRQLTRQLLEHFGYEVTDAPSAARALEIYAASPSPFRLLITDVSMPEMDGTELVRRLRAVDPGLRVLFFTGYSEELARYPADLRDLPVLAKPFSAEALADAVRRAIGRSAAA
ncbi:MAG: ATP-binding protein [Bryobacteraceae bacterium]|nr:ATP-binding protein [Bryobacteraceae bacterium]